MINKNSLLALFCTFFLLGQANAQEDTNGQEPDWQQLMVSTDPALQTEWGARYEHGEGVPQDYSRAIGLYCAAARRGHAGAQYRLGWLYANSRGVDRDDALAAAWFRLAAAQEDKHARRMLPLVDDPNHRKRPKCIVPENNAQPSLRLAGISAAKRRQIETWVRKLAPSYGLEPELVLAVIEVESAFNSRAVSNKNAQGLMQLIPATAERFGVQDTMDPQQNLRGGMAYLRWLLAFFQGDVRLALAGYNAGERAVERYRAIPPFPETQAYVAKVTRLYPHLVHPPVDPVVKPSAALVAMELKPRFVER